MVAIDFSYLDMLSEGDDDFKREYLETFESNYTSLTAKMQEELKRKDFESLGRTAHQLKPTAKMIKIPCSEQLELLQHHPHEATKEQIESIRTECEKVFVELVKWANLSK